MNFRLINKSVNRHIVAALEETLDFPKVYKNRQSSIVLLIHKCIFFVFKAGSTSSKCDIRTLHLLITRRRTQLLMDTLEP